MFWISAAKVCEAGKTKTFCVNVGDKEGKMYGNHATESGVGLLSQSRGLKLSGPMNQTASIDGDCKPIESKGECRLEGNLYHTEH